MNIDIIFKLNEKKIIFNKTKSKTVFNKNFEVLKKI